MSVKDRIRRVDLDSLKEEQVDKLALQLGKKAGEIITKAQEECNKFLEIYGVQIKIGYDLIPKNKE